jgi:predicted nucleic acid-binding protein
VLVYAAAGKRDDPVKHDIAAKLVLQAQFAISAQVLGEFYGVVRYNQNEMLNMSEAQNWILRLQPFCKLDVGAELVSSAMFIKERFKIQFWDAALIAATERLNLKTLYSEDMSHGQKYGSVTVINPFKAN